MERTVSQVAARVGLPERTVRYYDRIGLVSPPERSSVGYRLYGLQDEGKLRFVRQAKALGLSLNDIRGLIVAAERGCCGQVVPELERLLDDKIVEIGAQITDLAHFRDRLVAYRRGRGASCGCSGGAAFCGCLNDAPREVTAGGGAHRPKPTRERAQEATMPEPCECGCDYCRTDGAQQETSATRQDLPVLTRDR